MGLRGAYWRGSLCGKVVFPASAGSRLVRSEAHKLSRHGRMSAVAHIRADKRCAVCCANPGGPLIRPQVVPVVRIEVVSLPASLLRRGLSQKMVFSCYSQDAWTATGENPS